jgi:hypothetical protein
VGPKPDVIYVCFYKFMEGRAGNIASTGSKPP